MSDIDVDALTAEIAEEPPSGPDLEYDPDAMAMEELSEGTPERQMGDSIIPAEPPDWAAISKLAKGVLGRSHDLRAAVLLARGALHTGGFSGFRAGLTVIQRLLEQYWPSLYPQLDGDANGTARVNLLESLAHFEATLAGLRQTPLVANKVLGSFGLREIEIATGVEAAPASLEDDEVPTETAIDAAFQAAELSDLEQTAADIEGAQAAAEAIQAAVRDQVGAEYAPNFSALRDMLVALGRQMAQQLERRGIGSTEGVDGEASDEAGEAGGAGGAAASAARGPVSSREDVVRALEAICEYYRRHEPSSPIPILLQRAKRLVTKDFMELVQDLAPSGMSELELIRGAEPEE